MFPRGCGEKHKSFSLLTPDDYLQALFRQLWQEAGGTFAGRVREGQAPPSARLLATWESPPLAEIIRDVNKWSNNVMARQLFLTLGLERDAPPATTVKATRAVQEWLRQAGLEMPELVLENGSGLSRSEQISARNLARLLQRGWNSPLLPEYLASLPIPGVDGTLRRRLAGSPAAGQAHLKSGYIDGVRAVAGYLRDHRGRWLLLVCIVNHPNAIAAQPFLDAVVDWAWSQNGDDAALRECAVGEAEGPRACGAAVPTRSRSRSRQPLKHPRSLASGSDVAEVLAGRLFRARLLGSGNGNGRRGARQARLRPACPGRLDTVR